MDDSKDDKDQKPGGLLITFPNGKAIDKEDLGAEYVVGQGGQVNTPELIDVTEEEKKREAFIRDQPLIRALADGVEIRDLITHVLKEIAEELAHLKWERKKASSDGKNTANYNTARAAGLQQLAATLLKRQENSRAEQLDLKSPRFQSILKLWLDFVYEAMQKSGLDDQEIDVVFTTMKADMVEWERKILDV